MGFFFQESSFIALELMTPSSEEGNGLHGNGFNVTIYYVDEAPSNRIRR